MRSSLICLGILGGAIPTLAQPAAAPISTPAKPAIHDSVLVTAALADETEDRLPVSADVIGKEEIAARQATAIADLLRTVSGLDIVRSGTPGKVTSLFTRGTESDQTLVLWNGIELNDPFFGGFDWGLLPTEGVERVEVVRGPFSALYGSDALGGVVQVISGHDAANVLSLEAGEDGYGRATLSAGGELGRARFDVAAHSRRGDGPVDNDYFDSDALMARGTWQAGVDTQIGLVVRTHQADLGIPFSGGSVSPNRTSSWRETEVAVPFDTLAGGWKLEGRVSRVAYDSELSDPDDPFGYTFSHSESTSQRGRLVASHHVNDDLWIAVGGEYEDQTVDSGSVFGVDLDGAGQTTRALFSQLFYAVGAWRFDVGVRRDDHDAFGGTTTPRLGVARRLGSRGRLHVAYGEGFRAPSVGELYYPGSGNPDLRPEESTSLEVGYRVDGSRWGGSVTAFHNDLDNLIDFDFVDFRNVNVGRARTEGVELGIVRRWSAANLRADATWLDAEDRITGLPLLRRPEWRASTVATWTPAEWSLSATATYTGERDDVDPITFERRPNPAYERLDVAVRYLGWPRWSPYARVENLIDEAYAEALGFAAPGRQWIGGVSLRF
jgi:vitamin B12 transporter